jgi:aminopeptidase N
MTPAPPFPGRAGAVLSLLLLLTGHHIAFADKYPVNRNIHIRHYAFEISLSDSADELRGVARVTVLFRSDSIDRFSLDLVNRSDSLGGKGMVVESVSAGDKLLSFVHEENKLLIYRPVPFAGHAELTFTIRYHGIPADGLHIGNTRYGQRSFFSNNWPNKARQWLPVIDHPHEKATCEFIVTAPAHYQVVSNGLLVEETDQGRGMRLTHWKQSVPISCWLYVLGVTRFAVQHLEPFEGRPVQTWVYPEDRDKGFYDLAGPTREVCRFFSEDIGPYDFEKIANIQSPAVSGGMEAASAICYGEKLVTGKRDAGTRNVIIHELAHQWFGNAVTESSWDDAWLSEGFATFFTLRFLEKMYGEEEYRAGLLKAKNLIYTYYKKDTGYAVVADRTAEEGPVTNYNITYQKGAWVLHMLRDLIGEQAFKKGIRAYYKHFRNKLVVTADFRREMEKASNRDLSRFFYQWLYRGENPMLKGTWKYDPGKKQVIISLKQVQPGNDDFDIPVQFGIYRAGDPIPEIHTFRLNSKAAEWRIGFEKKPVKLDPDPRMVLLALISLTEDK